MKIKLNDNFDFLGSWPRLTLQRIQSVFDLINAEIQWVSDNNAKTVEIKISDKKFYTQNLEDQDVLNVLDWISQYSGLIISWKYLPKTKSSDGLTKISMPTEELDKFQKFGDSLKKSIAGEITEKASKKGRKNISDPIKEVVCVEPKTQDGDNAKLILNGVYKNPILISLIKKWRILFDVAKSVDQSIPFQKGDEDFLEYINGNDNCPIYSNTNYKKTKILKNDHSQIVPLVKLEIISNDKFNKRLLRNRTET
ncbi:MAG: hypothetical protein EXS52_01255 [Candidatus Staskawiczbacteria bacterium]|nr:hypothetical protein [Candidatus Staskawiczbacteria bacterium]